MTKKDFRSFTRQIKNIYFAGKISKYDWRWSFIHYPNRIDTEFPYGLPGDEGYEWPILEDAVFGKYNYVGPFFISCDHGCDKI